MPLIFAACWPNGMLFFLLVYLALSAATRLALLGKAAGDVAWNAGLLAAAGWGLLFDLAGAVMTPLKAVPPEEENEAISYYQMAESMFNQRRYSELGNKGEVDAVVVDLLADDPVTP